MDPAHPRHIDHIGGAHALWEATGRRAQVVIHEADAPLLRFAAGPRRRLPHRPRPVPERPRRGREGHRRHRGRHLRGDGTDHARARRRNPLPRRGSRDLRALDPRAHPGIGRLRRRRPEQRVRRRRRPGARRRQRLPRLHRPRRLPRQPRLPARDDPPREALSRHPTAAPTAPPTASNSTATRPPKLRESVDIEGECAAPRTAACTDCSTPTRRTRRSPRSPTTSVTPAIPPSSRPRSSPHCTATAPSSRTSTDHEEES